MRSFFETLEAQQLAPYAVKSHLSQGRQFDEPPSDTRTCFQRDRDRIIHSKSFRRLKHKTQVFSTTISDHYRSRLTHTLEVAQISRHIARMLRLNEDLTECIALAHDLGHPPFGHAGERELHDLMQDFGGFEHNVQSLRIVETLERKYPQFSGLNLSFEVREGLKKHDTSVTKTLEAQVVNVADEIAYNNHDLDDGLSSGLIKPHDLEAHVSLWTNAKQRIRTTYAQYPDDELKYVINSALISAQVTDLVTTSQARLLELNLQSVDQIQQSDAPIISFSSHMKKENRILRQFLFTYFYSHSSVYRMNKKGRSVIRALFEAFASDIKLLPEAYQARVTADTSLERVTADYIAGMTDSYAFAQFDELF